MSTRTGETVAIETPYMTRVEAAEYLRTTIYTLDRRIKDKSLKSYRFGRSVLLHREDLDNYLKQSA